MAQSLHNVAALPQAHGRHGPAEVLLGRALSIREDALGNDHLLVAATLDALAKLRRQTGRPAQTGPLEKRAPGSRAMLR